MFPPDVRLMPADSGKFRRRAAGPRRARGPVDLRRTHAGHRRDRLRTDGRPAPSA
ncbi:hypothetical protein STXM2123_2583 [Streptomyces sp. F-3]|nr:hypothetical protein STXM2123_2583 [Streptomyces sp. F-3]